MKIVIFSLFLPVAILSFLPERAWAPPTMIEITGEVVLISVGDGSITGEPWVGIKTKHSNLWESPPPDSGQGAPPGGPWW